MLLADLLLGFGIGLLLGMLGGGGSILTVPALVYVVGQSPNAAVTTSLAIVGANSTMGVFFHRKQGTLNGQVALLFGGAGIGIAYLMAGISDHIDPALLLSLFAGLMLFIALVMIAMPQPENTSRTVARTPIILLSGASVGLLTGLLGVGGGFLIVPALVLLVGLPMRQAVGTSLIIIATNSLAGFLGHLGNTPLDTHLLMTFVAAGLSGTFAGAKLACHLPAQHLRQVFALFVLTLGIFLLVDNLPKL